MTENITVEAELDLAHLKANQGYHAKDVKAYMAIFAPDLKYKQPDGRVIGREQLARDVKSQFSSVQTADTSYVRESLQVDSDRAIEILIQEASITTSHFVFMTRVWRLKRRGRYTWIRLPDGWKIQEVEVLHESVSRGTAQL
jgi:ketosteroid isomerase-like protein